MAVQGREVPVKPPHRQDRRRRGLVRRDRPRRYDDDDRFGRRRGWRRRRLGSAGGDAREQANDDDLTRQIHSSLPSRTSMRRQPRVRKAAAAYCPRAAMTSVTLSSRVTPPTDSPAITQPPPTTQSMKGRG